jgi:hypothetical protein
VLYAPIVQQRLQQTIDLPNGVRKVLFSGVAKFDQNAAQKRNPISRAGDHFRVFTRQLNDLL